MALVCPEGKILYQCEGKVCGIIIDEIKGKNGFGYDPVFYLPEYRKTMAQIEPDIKNKISHRANALGPMLEWIHKNLV
jgi:XTP/dITP diphosphohydrolase